LARWWFLGCSVKGREKLPSRRVLMGDKDIFLQTESQGGFMKVNTISESL
jgi:hypothetical protein